jgi:glycosyltransferase involved in cell wall biosynthesis
METAKEKINIVYLFPGPIYRPDLPDIKGRFEVLSEHFEGEIYSWTCDKNYQKYQVGNFVFRGLVVKGPGLVTRLRLAAHIIRATANLSHRKKINVVVCYDPIFTGIVGALLKMIFRCKLIIELNTNDLGKAMQIEGGKSLKTRLKICISKILLRISLFFSDGIKVLMQAQKDKLIKKHNQKKIFCFHDFVPTYFFEKDEKRTEKYLLFIGFPFYRKGVDILVKAYEKIADQFPDFELWLIGHLLEEEARKQLGAWDDRIKFIKPIFYEELKPYFLNCYGFVLPSREEGLARVLIEAMACAKPLIGSNIVGTASVIKDGENGFLFESENVNDLAQKIAMLLKEPERAHEMGEKGLQYVEEKFSSKKYCEYFMRMVQEIMADEKQ